MDTRPPAPSATPIGIHHGLRPSRRMASPGFQQWLGRAPRRARIATALTLAVAATLVVALGPLCWWFASGELRAIDRGKARDRDRSWIAFAERWGMGTTFVAIAIAGFLATVAVRRLI